MRRSLPLFAAVLALFSQAQSQIEVRVVDPLERPVFGARISVESAGRIWNTETDAQGLAAFPSLNPQRYRVRVLAPAFAELSEEVDFAQHVPTLKLSLPVRSDEVQVTAGLVASPEDELNAVVSVINAYELTARQPINVLDAVRFVPGVIVASSGRRGSIGSLFVRGGESRYNKVIVDGVVVNDPGGTFDFGVVPAFEADRIELLRGPGSTLYGSDAMTSVVQLFTATGHTRRPEVRFGAEGGTFSTARGFSALAGSINRFDYNVFGDQFHTEGQGINDAYWNAHQGANLGFQPAHKIGLRLRMRHSNSRSGVQNAWVFNQQPLLTPDADQFARQNNFLAALDVTLALSPRWKHTLRGSEYNHRRRNVDAVPDRGCDPINFDFNDCFFDIDARFNRAAFDYQGEFTQSSWSRSVFGYQYENENGNFNTQFTTLDFATFASAIGASLTRGLRQNHAIFGHQTFNWQRVNLVAGLRYVRNESFGDRVVPQASLSFLLLPGDDVFSGTRLRFAYGEGIKEPRFEESFGVSGTFITLSNPDLRSEGNRALEAGLIQGLGGSASFSATYFHNRFRDQIVFDCDPLTFECRYENLSASLAHGAELTLHTRPTQRVTFDLAYVHTSSQLLRAPTSASGLFTTGSPLLRRPKHSASATFNFIGSKWGANANAVYVGRRADSDFFLLPAPITTADSYSRVDAGGWYTLQRNVTAYLQIENAFNRKYEEVLGYPALKANFRAGMRFRFGGD